ncbi:leucine-rich repeat domain-containing protein [Mollicutes bacterium LVI A0039]|nr:leucine-rich repeat domain-containing protein [Mollicutes bacterium LVI A0039]
MNKFRIFSILTLVGLILITTSSTMMAASVELADPNLQDCLDATLKVKNIEASNATALKRLDCSSKNISSLEGIDQLVNLEYLYLNNNSISDIDQLEYLENLKYLQLYSNDIDSVEALSSLTDLRQLLIDDNNITDISGLGSLEKLMILSANDNNITSIDALDNLTSLRELNLVNNKIKNLSGLENLTSLQKLRLENNQITNIDALADLDNLQVVYLSNNQIDSLESLTSLNAVTELFVDNNKLTDLSSLQNVSSLKTVSARDQNIVLEPITVTNSAPLEYIVTGIDGTSYPVSLAVTKNGKDTLTSKWNVTSDSIYFSGSVSQEVNYKAQSKLSGKSKASSGERNKRSDAQLIELFEVKNNKDKKITVDQSAVDYNTIGTYPVVFTDSDFNVVTAKLVVADTLPKITVESRSIDVILGQQINDYANVYGAVATEVTSGDLQQQLQVDASQVNYAREGQYPIVFTVADAQGNKTSTKVEVKISKRKFSIPNPGGSRLHMYKTSKSGAGLHGYEYTVYDKEGNVVEVIVTDADGFAKSEILYPGDYYIEQTGAPDGEVINHDRLSITETINVVNVGNDNAGTNGSGNASVDVNISGNTGEIVGQVGVYLTTEDGTLVDYSVSDETGNVHFDHVAIGTYRLILDSVSNASFSIVDEQNIEVSADSEDHQFDLIVKSKTSKALIVSLIVLLICLLLAAIRYFTKK